MPSSTKRRRSTRDVKLEQKEEEDLVASLFGVKKSRRGVSTEVRDELEEDELNLQPGLSTHRQNPEQYLDDDKLFMLDTGRDANENSQEDRNSEGSSVISRGNEDEEEEENDDSDSSNGETSITEERLAAGDPEQTKENRRRPVWTDPSISNLKISLAGPNPNTSNGSRAGTKKLRKLREEQEETQISGAEYELRLRKLFEKLHPRPVWASLAVRKASEGERIKESGREALSNLLSRDTGLVARVTKKGKQGQSRLPQGQLEMERLRNANESQGRATFSPIESLSFHPSNRAHVLMTTTKDRRLRLFQVDGNTNPLLETLHIAELPMQSALFHPSGSSILLSGPRPFFYSHDLESGKTVKSTPWRGFGSSAVGAEEKDLSNVCFQSFAKDSNRSLLAIGGRRGAIHLLEWGSVGGSGGGSLVGSLHMNAPLAGITWNSSKPHSLVSLSTLGIVHSWDIRNMKCEVQKSDPGLYAPKSIKASPNGDWWAIGSDSGIVNMYGSEIIDSSHNSKTTMQSQKSIKNITLTTTSLHFNHSSEMLALASDKKKDALKVVHLPSLTVFENWPTAGTPLGRVSSLGFSNNSEYLAIGNSRGKVLLYSIRHYL